MSRNDSTVCGSGRPIEFSLTGPLSGLQLSTGEVSERPYPSTTLQPVSFSNWVFTSSGSGAPPDKQNLSEERSKVASFLWLMMALNSVGTPGMIVGFVLLMSLSASSRTKRGMMTSSAARSIP